MAYTEFILVDNSDIPILATAIVPYQPLFMVASSSDKGPENYGVYSGQEFVDTFVTNIKTVFDIHGQALLQAIRCAEAGGRIFFKRVVAPDATLANTTVSLRLTVTSENVTDADGNQLYIDPLTGQQTTDNSRLEEDGTTTSFSPVTKDVVSADFVAQTTEGITENDIDAIADTVRAATIDEDGGVYTYPLFVITDSGRGNSKKVVRFSPDYTSSRIREYMKYVIAVYENNTQIESNVVTLDPTVVENSVNLGLGAKINDNSKQIKAKEFQENITAAVAKIAELTGLTEEEVLANDFIFGKTRRGLQLSTSYVVNNNLSLNSVGVRLMSGDNGEFGTSPRDAEHYVEQMVAAFSEREESSDIYDVDNYKLDFVCDANYPAPVKRAIETFVEFRGDCQFMRDLGLGLRTLDAIKAADEHSSHSIYCASYHNSYDTYDPYTKKRINVTIMYDLAPMLVDHYVNGENRPVAGLLHKLIFDGVIDGTINFNPRKTPSFDQKQELDDARINYMASYDGVWTLDSEWTSQIERHTQLSYVNNMLAVERIIKEIRTLCPAIRYTFLDGNDLKNYQDDVNAVINASRSKFKSIEMVYFADPNYEANKIFYAGIDVSFRDFVQNERFVITALQV